jgi:probable HAF family extracellular repeat protein
MVVGNSRLAESTDAQLVAHAYKWQSGVMTDLGTLGGTVSNAKGVNNRGQIVGYATTADGASRGVLWENGAIYDLNTLLPANSGWQIAGTNTNAINDSGQIVGQGLINGHQHAFRISDSDGIYANGGAVITDLGTLGGPNSNGIAINNLGQVAGSSNTSDGSLRAFRYSGSTITDLKSVYGISNGSGINDAGLVVGGSEYRGWTYANEWHAFLWQAGKIADLNLQLPRGSTWTLEVAYDINKDGRIVGSMLVNGQRHAFMMVPSTSSSTPLAAAAPAAATFSTVPIVGGAVEVLAVNGVTVLG